MKAVCEIVVKIGGSTLGSHDTTLDDVAALHRQGRRVAVVHGGGAMITEWLKRHGIEARFERGLRVTDEASMEVVVAVLAGLVNKRLVGELLARGVPAFGLCGADSGLVQASIQDAALGRVGEVDSIDAALINYLIADGRVPVIAPIGCESAGGKPTGALLNVNADTAAGHIAAALGAESLVFMTDVAGVMDADKRVRQRMSGEEAIQMIADGTIAGGMIPKVQAGITATRAGTATRIVDGREPHALLGALTQAQLGTVIG